MIRILLVEDDANKARSIIDFLNQSFNDIEIEKAASYQSGVDLAIDSVFDLLLLDMSIPNFDSIDSKESGESLKNGGELIVEELLDEGVDFHCTVITQYETFNNETLQTIDTRLKLLCKDRYHGCIKYDTFNDNWKQQLKNNIEHVINNHN